MLTLLKHLDRQVLAQELPSLFCSMLIAEYAFKFHSFTLECLAFLTLWGATSALTGAVMKAFK